MKSILLKVSDELYSDIKNKSERTERTVSQYIRDIIVTSDHPFVTVANLERDPSCLNPS